MDPVPHALADLPLSELMDTLEVDLWVFDHRTGHTTWSRRMGGLLGEDTVVDAESAVAAVLERVHPRDRAALSLARAASLTPGVTFDAEFRYQSAEGRWSWLHARGRVVRRDAAGAPLVTAGTLTDVSERRRTERLVSLQQELNRVLAAAGERGALIVGALDAVLRLPELDGGAVYWRRDDGGFRLTISRGLGGAFLDQLSDIEPASAAAVVMTAEAAHAYALTPQLAETWPGAPVAPLLAEGVRGALIVPVQVNGTVLACLNLVSHTDASFDEEVVAALQGHALQIAQALQGLSARESAARQNRDLAGFFAAMQDFVFVVDGAGVIRHVNPAVEQKLGLTGLNGARLSAIHPARVRAEAEAITDAVVSGRLRAWTLPLRRADGSELTADTRAVVTEWDGLPAHLAVARDMTELEALQAEIVRRERYQRALLDNFPHMVWLKDRESRLLSANRAYARTAGVADPDSLVGKLDRDIWPRELAERYRADDVAVLASGQPCSVEEPIEEDGIRRWYETYKSPVIVDGAVIGTVGFARDITERAAARERMEQSEALLRATLEGTDDGILVVSSEGKVLTANRRFQQLWRIPDEVMASGDDDRLLSHGRSQLADPAAFYEQVARLYDSDETSLDTVAFVDGRRFERYSAPLTYGGRRARLWAFRDVTARGAIQAALERERGFLKTLIHTLPDLVWLKDPAGRYLSCNTRFEELYGASEAQIVGRTDDDFVPPDMASMFRENDRAAMAAGRTRVNEEWLTFAADGYRGLFETSKTPMYAADGRLIGVLGVAHDITAARHAAEAIREAELRWKFALEGSGLGVWDWDLAGEAVYYSPLWKRMIGYSESEIPDTTEGWRDLVHPDDLDPTLNALISHLRGEIPEYRVEFRMRHRQGYWRWVGSRGLVVDRDAEGIARRMIGVHMDIHAEREAQERLQASEAALQQAQALAHLGSWRLDLATHEIRSSAETLRIFGRDEGALPTLGELLGALHPDDIARFAAAWEATVQGSEVDVEHRILVRGEARWVRVRAALEHDEAGIGRSAVGSIQDITDRKRAELEVERHRQHLQELVDERTAELVTARDAAESANRTKSVFLANMSHEIRTPLNAIIGLTHLVREATSTAPPQRAQLEKVGDAAQHLLGLLDDILDLSKIEAGKIELAASPFRLGAVLDRVVDLLGEKAAGKGLELGVERDPAVPPVLVGDELKLGQILINFVSNAVKFTDRGGIVIRTCAVETGAGSVRLRVEVHDTGQGMTDEQKSRIFQPFEQGDTSSTRRHGGTGLGLAISKRLAERMGGAIGVDSAASRGSHFWCELPFAVGSPSALPEGKARPEAPARLPAPGTRVLVVEDNAINREVAVDLLRSIGLEVDTATDGLEALRAVQEQAYGLVLMDVQMPNMDGLEATRAIRQLPGCGRLPIIAMSADAFESVRRECLEAGMNAHVSKPVNPRALFEELRRWLPAGAVAAPDDADDGAWARLGAVPGLDVEAGVGLLRGRRRAYIRMLERFAADHADDVRRVQALRRQGAEVEARRVLHTLKGLLATLGMPTLAERTRTVERALEAMSPAEAEAALAGLGLGLDGIVAALRTAIVAETTTRGAAVAPEDLRVQARTLLRFVEQDDSRSAAALEAALPALASVVDPPLLARLRQQITGFDFPAAAATLRAALGPVLDFDAGAPTREGWPDDRRS